MDNGSVLVRHGTGYVTKQRVQADSAPHCVALAQCPNRCALGGRRSQDILCWRVCQAAYLLCS
jgi:hypothetical protein